MQGKLLAFVLVIGGVILIISGVKDATPGEAFKSLLQTGLLPKGKGKLSAPGYTPSPAGPPPPSAPGYVPRPAGPSRFI